MFFFGFVCGASIGNLMALIIMRYREKPTSQHEKEEER